MGFITLVTTANKEIVLNIAHIISMEQSQTGGTVMRLHEQTGPIDFVEKPNQVIFLLRAAGAQVITG